MDNLSNKNGEWFKNFNIEDFRKEHEVIITLDGEEPEYKCDGKYSVESYLKRLEEKKRHAAEESSETAAEDTEK